VPSVAIVAGEAEGSSEIFCLGDHGISSDLRFLPGLTGNFFFFRFGVFVF
jgi:hypothetical protein